MKKIIYSLFLFAAAAMLFASCSTNLSTFSITKRHYRSGYYIDMATTKHKTETASQKVKTTVAETTPVTQATVENNVLEPAPVIMTPATSADATPKAKRETPKIITASTTPSAVSSEKKTITPNTITELKNIRTVAKSISSQEEGRHSLLWFIVVILIVLFVLSLLLNTGLGSIIYLLLVIALILILFRLLGIM
jgi:cobalamin biosynthesis Mg chelatase CobN